MADEQVVPYTQPANSPWEQMKQEAIILGRCGFFPHIKNVEQAMAIVLMGRDLGISPTRAIYGINVIDSKPSLSAALMSQLIFQHHGGDSLFFEESTDTTCVLLCKRKDSTRVGKVTYTIEQAEAAGLTSKKNWKADPTSMLRNRCITNAARMHFPDVIAGSYLTEEMESSPARTTLREEEWPVVTQPETTDREIVEGMHGSVVAETGELVEEPMNAEQRVRIRALQIACGQTDAVEEMTNTRAAQHIVDLMALLAKQQAKAKEEAAKKEARKAKTKPAAEPPAEQPAPAQPAPTQGEPEKRGTLMQRLTNAQRVIHSHIGYQFYIDPLCAEIEEMADARLRHVHVLYNHIASGKNGTVPPADQQKAYRKMIEMTGQTPPQAWPAAVTSDNILAIVSELKEHITRIKNAEMQNDPMFADPSAEEAAKQKALEERQKALKAKQDAEEKAEKEAKAKAADPFGMEDLPLL